MTTQFLVCAAITSTSALVSFGFSFLATRNPIGEVRTIAFYAMARSTALVLVSLASFAVGWNHWLYAIAVVMIVVQSADAVIGLTIGSRLRTIGPAATAMLNLAALVWLIQG